MYICLIENIVNGKLLKVHQLPHSWSFSFFPSWGLLASTNRTNLHELMALDIKSH